MALLYAIPSVSSVLVDLLLVAIGLTALGCFSIAAREFRTVHRVFSTPTGRVSGLLTDPEGPIELHGTARAADEAFAGPFTGEECLICETAVEEYRWSFRRGGSWRRIDSDFRSVPFLLEDGSGSVLVDPRNADVRMGSDAERIDVDGGSEPPRWIGRYIRQNDRVSCENRRLDLGPLSIPRGADRRYTERRIQPGDEVYVLGRAHRRTTRAGSVNAVVGDGSDESPPLIGEGSTRRNGLRALGRGGRYFGEGVVVTLVLALALIV